MTSIRLQRPAWGPRDWIIMLAIGIIAGAVRLIRLGDPPRRVFDEAFYAREGCLYAGLPATACTGREHLEVHPPLAKRLIGIGIDAFGYDGVGWRLASAVVGIVSILLIYVLARRLLRSTFAASLTAGLLAFDFLHFVHSRVAMLDMFVAGFSIASFVFLAIQRDELTPPSNGCLRKTLLLGMGISSGAAMASKWSGGFTLIACIWLLLAWSSKYQKRASSFGRLAAAVRQHGVVLVVFLVVVPLVVYSATFIGAVHPSGTGATSATELLQTFQARHQEMLNFHRHTIETTIASSPAWSWPFIRRPVPYFAQKTDDRIVEVWFGGNPLVWWPGIACLAYLLIRWARKQDPQEPIGFIIAGFTLLYAPWFLLTMPPFTWDRDLVFIFYLLPTLPFLYLALTHAIQSIPIDNVRHVVAILSATAAIGGFLFFYPILSGVPISRESWLRRVGWFDDCSRPTPPTLVVPNLSTAPGAEPGLVTLTLRSDDPPTGWCWK